MCNNFSFPKEMPLTNNLFSTIIDLSKKVDDKFYQTNLESPSVKKMVEGITEKEFVYQYRRYYMRKNETGLCPTLTANMGLGGHNVPLILDDFGIRKLTVEECFKLQGFNFDTLPNIALGQLYKQSGNAVSVPVVRRILENIIGTLNVTSNST
jgi:DNA (cytosine-5)-methyltransferase 1